MGRRDKGFCGTGTTLLLAVAMTVVVSGCGTFSGFLKSDDAMTAGRQGAGVVESTTISPPSVAPIAEPDAAEAVTTDQPAEEVAAEAEDTPTLLSLADEGELVLAERPAELYGGYALAQRAQDPTDAVDEEYA